MNATGNKLSVVTRLVVLWVLTSLLPGAVYSQMDSMLLGRVKRFSFGVVAGMGQSCDGVIGIEATSPSFLKNTLSIRMNGGLHWMETYDSQSYRVNKHPSLGASVVYQSFVSQRARLFFEIGAFVLLPSPNLSESTNIPGYSGSTGFELFSRPKSGIVLSYFFAGGYAVYLTRSSEAKYPDDYRDGFIFTNGLRFYF